MSASPSPSSSSSSPPLPLAIFRRIPPYLIRFVVYTVANETFEIALPREIYASFDASFGQPLLVRWRAPAHAQTVARVGDAVKIEIALSRLSRVIFDRNFFFFLFRFSLTFSRSRMRYPVKLRISKHTQGWRRGNERKIPLRFAISSRKGESRVYVSKEIISPPLHLFGEGVTSARGSPIWQGSFAGIVARKLGRAR